jgi:sortase A
MMKKSKKTAMLFIGIGIAFILSAIMLFVFNEITSYRTAQETVEILDSLENEMLEDISVPVDTTDGVMPIRLVDGINVVGVVSIPSLGIEVPVAAEWSYEMLRKSACRYSGTAKDGRLIILAHNYAVISAA